MKSVAMTYVTGPHGEKISLLGYGAMRMPTSAVSGAFDKAAVRAHVEALRAGGVNYFDAAPVYCQGECEKILGEVLSAFPRDSYYVATKLSNFAASLQTPEASRQMYETSQRLLGRGYLDFYLLHSVGNGGLAQFRKRYLDNGMLDFCLAQRKAGRIRNLGFSFHGPVDVFDFLMAMHDKVHWDFVQIQLNYLDWDHASQVNARNPNASYLYGECEKRHIPVVAMEPLLGGRLAKFNYSAVSRLGPLDPTGSMAKWAFRFAASKPLMMSVISGMNNLDHIAENIATFSPLKRLSPTEFTVLDAVSEAVLADRTVPCNSCNYCMPCPFGVDIPTILSCWNAALTEKRMPDDPSDAQYERFRTQFLRDYVSAVPEKLRRVDHCIGCGRCIQHCPQMIDIPRELARINRSVSAIRARKGFAL